jgi:Ca2+-binding RTX toxin-like protein
VLMGGNGDDLIEGWSGQENTLTGDAGNDILMGGHENDTISGGDGDDMLMGDNNGVTYPGPFIHGDNDTCNGGAHVAGDKADADCEVQNDIESPL